MNPLQQLHTAGQSFWLDFISRHLIKSGELKKMIAADGIRGMTSNPTIFEKAISTGKEYDSDLKKAAAQGKSVEDIFEVLAIKDIQDAADLLKPVYQSSKGTDGFISLEVSPTLAYDTKGTLAAAIRLFKKVKRSNLMIKIPGTQEGLPAIEEATAQGININITLLFSVENYKQVLEAYIRGLERRSKKKLPISKIASVASFFVSRVDSTIDKQLDQLIAQGDEKSQIAKTLLHKSAIANAKLAYAHYLDVKQSNRWKTLEARGAQPQRLLWASTGTKDKRMSDVVYVNDLIGPETVNTMPPQTADAFRDHGAIGATLSSGLDDAKRTLSSLTQLGISIEAVAKKLQTDGVQSFAQSFELLMQGIGAKREFLLGEHDKRCVLSLGSAQKSVEQELARIQSEKWVDRIWAKDAALWKNDEAHQKIIKNSLGWLTVAATVRQNLPRLQEIVSDIKRAKFTHILLLGMGGSSLAPEVLRLIFGKKAGYPDLAILDSTEPASVLDRAKRSKPSKTLYIVASKSGSTTEPNAFLAAFYDRVVKEKGARAGENFIAITDPGTHMERVAKEKKFRHIILNPSDIGGRYSAISFFGMVPAALMGLNVSDLLDRVEKMAYACSVHMPFASNPGARLGAALGVLAKQGRDKVTFVLSKELVPFSTWVEQLIAESTGKEGKGILPVEAEELLNAQAYGNDRVFVSLRTAQDKDKSAVAKLKALQKAGYPVFWITLKNKSDIVAEFFRWEFATAVAGGVLSIDPFDQPNVQEAKDLTKTYLDKFKAEGSLSTSDVALRENGFAAYAPSSAPAGNFHDALQAWWNSIHSGDYVGILAYIERNAENNKTLQELRDVILKAKKVATTVGFGPRFLHSTGQLHKGGANNGVFLQITATDPVDAPVPGEPYSFSVLKEAQALGDLSALRNKGRRVLKIHVADVRSGLPKLVEAFREVSKN